MTAAIKAQINAQTLAPRADKAPAGTPVPPAAQRPVDAKLSGGKDTVKEQPGPKANAPIRYATAGPLHAEQHPGEFRVVVVGPLPLLPALVQALDELCRAAKTQSNNHDTHRN